MSEPVVTMVAPNDVARGPCDAAERGRVSRGLGANPLLHECPGRFDRVEIMRVGRQITNRGAALFNEAADGGLLVGFEIVEHDDIALLAASADRCNVPSIVSWRLRRDRCEGERTLLLPKDDGAAYGLLINRKPRRT